MAISDGSALPSGNKASGAMDAETSPQGRYIRVCTFRLLGLTFLQLFERIGTGSYKEVYVTNVSLKNSRWRAVDTDEGVEVAWNVVKLSRIPESERKRIKNEVKLLKSLSHANILGYSSSWINREKEEVIFVTEIMSSGSLKE